MDREPDAIATALVPGVHRVIRVLDADEGPFRGSLVANGSGVAVLADAAEYAGWSGWALAGCEHVVGPLDMVRRTDGHDVLLPWCVERVEAFLGRRSAADAVLVAGEVSTLVVSLLRGMDEHAEHGGDDATGAWWLTEAGRPVFVVGAGDDVRSASARIIDRMRRDCSDRPLGRVLADVHTALMEGRVRPRPSSAQLARWESELFEIAAPRALALQVQAPERVRDIAVVQRARESAAVDMTSRRERRRRLQPAPERVGGIAVRFRDARTAVGERLHGVLARLGGSATSPPHGERQPPHGERQGRLAGRRASRGRALLVAGSAATAVLIGGLLWPGGATDPSGAAESTTGQSDAGGSDFASSDAGDAGSTPGSAAPEGETNDAEPSAATSADGETDGAPIGDGATDGATELPDDDEGAPQGAGSDDPVVAAQALLEMIRACDLSGDAICSDAVAGGSLGVVESVSPLLAEGSAPTVALVDVYGDVAVVRANAAGDDSGSESVEAGGEQSRERMLVLIRQNDNWLVRDAYDVADQPG